MTDVDRFLGNLHGGKGHRTGPQHLSATIAHVMNSYRAKSVAVPAVLPETWLDDLPADTVVLRDDPPLTLHQLEAAHISLTACALAVATSGAVALDGGPGQGRRVLSLIPERHVCVVRASQIVDTLSGAFFAFTSKRSVMWITAPSDGVLYGRRSLDVIVVDDRV
ncbi:LUD domain-containing protein [Streptomyces gamaensis]|uniref:LUD domain-containing protein n=1 Tax=Streptomyces gamaensis TaxID=1763542 RepID=UPI0036F31F0E